MIDLQTATIGTPHPTATCCWCGTPLVVGQVVSLKCWLCPTDWPRQVKHALVVTPKRGDKVCYNVPLPSQVMLSEAPARNVLWGGQAGPGKSHGVRHLLYERSLLCRDHKALLLRENYGQLETTHLFDMRRELPQYGAKLVDDVGRFPNGAEIHCGHMADAQAIQRYLSTEYGVIVADEASLYPVDAYGITTLAELRTRARKDYIDVQGNRLAPKFIPVTNPGGPSAAYLAEMFIDHLPDYDKFPKLRPVYNEKGEQTSGYRAEDWIYLPARLDDNPYMRDDYRQTDLAGLSGVRYRQLAEGDWRVFSGQFFSEWAEVKDGQPWHVQAWAA